MSDTHQPTPSTLSRDTQLDRSRHGERGEFELFGVNLDRDRHWGRKTIRLALWQMEPLDRSLQLRAPVLKHGVFWGLTAPNGLTLALRARNFSGYSAARADARAALVPDPLLTLQRVRDADGRHSFWVVKDRRIVFVAGRAWRQWSGRAESFATRLLFALQEGSAERLGSTEPPPPPPPRR